MTAKVGKKQLIKAIEDTNGMVMLAAKTLGITRDAIYKRARKDPEIQKAIELAREELIDLAESKLRIAIMNGEPWAIALTLRTIGKNRGYVERLENTGLDGESIRVNTTIYLPDNNRDKLDSGSEELEDGNTITVEAREV